MSDTVHFECRAATALITLDRPAARNAVDLATADAPAAAFSGWFTRST